MRLKWKKNEKKNYEKCLPMKFIQPIGNCSNAVHISHLFDSVAIPLFNTLPNGTHAPNDLIQKSFISEYIYLKH